LNRMRKLLILLMLVCCTTIVQSQQTYYYCKGRKIPIFVNSSKEGFAVKKGVIGNDFIQSIKSHAEIMQDNLYDFVFMEIGEESKSIKSNISRTMSKNVSEDAIRLPCYYNETGQELALTNYLNVKLKEAEDFSVLQNIAKEYKLDIIQNMSNMPLWYILAVTAESDNDPIYIANEIYETGLFSEVMPTFLDGNIECSYDPLIYNQWGLYNADDDDIDISICSAWNYATGNGIKIAILDQGIDLVHNDLLNNIYPLSYDTEKGTSPSSTYGSHGTHCAGIAAAVRNNGVQIAGVAPDAKLISISNRLISTTNTAMRLADGMMWAWKNGADIISNSWYLRSSHPAIEEAIDSALTRGRDRKGCIVVFSAGNGNSKSVNYPANYSPKILTVGAIDKRGVRSTYSNYGQDLDVVAPGDSILSTLPNNQTGYQSGTSMACPHVAGIAALILQRNPTLTTEQVNNIIESNTNKLANVDFDEVKTNGSWNQYYGYGLVDAYKAVKNTPR